MAELGTTEFDHLLHEARRSLEKVRSGGTPPTEEKDLIQGAGDAADGRITAIAVTGGRLDSLHIDPRALRMGSEELSANIVVAVNAAFADLRTKAGESAAGDETPDLGTLSDQLRDVQDQSMRQMTMFTGAIADALAQLGRRG